MMPRERMMDDLLEHRHRFSLWAAARAAQRGLKGGTVGVLRDALDQSGVVGLAKAANLPVDHLAYDEVHRAWRRSIISYLASRSVHASFGRAAKLIAIYLKGMVILSGNAETSQARVIHPPIDGILLGNMRKASDALSTHKTVWRNVKWTALGEDESYRLIDQLRTCIAPGEPFWTIERFWTVTDQED